jgi:hypothetical protein
MPDLEVLSLAPPEPLKAEQADKQDPRPWIEAYEAGVGSPLELKFLHLFEKHGVVLEKQVPVAPSATSAPISQADFRVAGTKVLLYVDGAAFHTGNRLRRDRAIRQALRDGEIGWKIVELRARDLFNPEDTVRNVLQLAQD